MATELGKFLKQERTKKGWSLREVEGLTGIANAHLSQIETGAIERPAVSIIWTLSNVYKVDYGKLMKLAGHVQPKGERSSGRSLAGAALHAAGDLSTAETKELIRFMETLRKRRTGREGG